MIIAIVGLKHFGKRICTQLKEFDKKNTYMYFDTYYSFIDKIKYLAILPFISTLYSINGTLQKSFVISFALLLRKKVVFHWVGSDLVQAKKDVAANQFIKKFVEKPIHLTDTPWYVKELEAIGIKGNYIPLTTVEPNFQAKGLPKEFSVLIYISKVNPDFYGLNRIIEIAQHLNNIKFYIVGISETEKELPENIKLLGWISDMDQVIANSVVVIRIPKHDGLSSFVIEALKNQRYVLYNYTFNHCFYVDDNQSIIDKLTDLQFQFNNNALNPNIEGFNFVNKNFNKNLIIKNLIFTIVN